MEYELQQIGKDMSLDELADIPTDVIGDDNDDTPDMWFPLKNKMILIEKTVCVPKELVGLMLVGYTSNLVSRSFFDQLWSILNGLFHLKIQAWSTVWRAQKRIQEYLKMETELKDSVFGMPCASLSSKGALVKVRIELSNPLVAPFLNLYPEDSSQTDQYKLSQSRKWLEMAAKFRVQMCFNNLKHFYIFEPVQTFSNTLLIPIFIYKINSELSPKFIIPKCISSSQSQLKLIIPSNIDFNHTELKTVKVEEILLPNPWRAKSARKIIQHIPITLYSDNTSGIFLKRWNKHISFFFTLSCLPPRLSNQEFNYHFLPTSNKAGGLELSGQIVDELNSISSEGVEAYDIKISQPVLIMSSVLFFLGNSPIHAEITNTPLPNNSLNPCRMCQLSISKAEDKHTEEYLQEFLQVNQDGTQTANPVRSWKKTIELPYQSN
ncbi:hypothetical protein VP01_486g3 [Puccinia sorghi]|uniref:Uncharacterized protein n=1 Tax=Puccinia sorghi TaxID=27349 RepID=A0A0L6UN11_9BASI|nr:hypothetical protein VP01_486g3 [Puccinia sorghi]